MQLPVFHRGIASSRCVGPVKSLLESSPIRVQGSCIGDKCRSENLASRPGNASRFGVARIETPWNAEGTEEDDDEANAEEEAELDFSGRMVRTGWIVKGVSDAVLTYFDKLNGSLRTGTMGSAMSMRSVAMLEIPYEC